ncbi:hypothetical protein PIB30_050137, partial [Stylosanthes scabra]|nr:hypothetical protein [Stylosanthes scabra]
DPHPLPNPDATPPSTADGHRSPLPTAFTVPGGVHRPPSLCHCWSLNPPLFQEHQIHSHFL